MPSQLSVPNAATLGALATLVRPVNCLITGLSVYVGAFTAGIRWPTLDIVVAAAAASLIAGAGNAFNDACDLDVDRLNRPQRPLPAGLLSVTTARRFSCLLAGIGLALAWWLSLGAGLIASCITILLILYNLRMQNRPLSGNLIVASVGASSFPFGALTTGAWGRCWIPAGFAFLFHLGREIIKDLEDIPGDRRSNAQTFAIRQEPLVAVHVSAVIFAVLVAFTLAPWLLGTYGLCYLGFVVLVDLCLIRTVNRLYSHRGILNNFRLSTYLKAVMVLGLSAILVGELFR